MSIVGPEGIVEVKYSSTLYTLSSVECALAIRSKMHQLRWCNQESLICTSSLHKFLCITTSWPIQSLTVAPWPMQFISAQASTLGEMHINAIHRNPASSAQCNTQWNNCAILVQYSSQCNTQWNSWIAQLPSLLLSFQPPASSTLHFALPVHYLLNFSMKTEELTTFKSVHNV